MTKRPTENDVNPRRPAIVLGPAVGLPLSLAGFWFGSGSVATVWPMLGFFVAMALLTTLSLGKMLRYTALQSATLFATFVATTLLLLGGLDYMTVASDFDGDRYWWLYGGYMAACMLACTLTSFLFYRRFGPDHVKMPKFLDETSGKGGPLFRAMEGLPRLHFMIAPVLLAGSLMLSVPLAMAAFGGDGHQSMFVIIIASAVIPFYLIYEIFSSPVINKALKMAHIWVVLLVVNVPSYSRVFFDYELDYSALIWLMIPIAVFGLERMPGLRLVTPEETGSIDAAPSAA